MEDVNRRELPPPRAVVERIVAIALEEDLGRGDVTTKACVPRGRRGEAHLVARDRVVFCGLAVVSAVYRQVDPDIEVHERCAEGTWLAKGQEAAVITGPAASILGGERVALNFAQRMSGIATLTRQFVEAVPNGTGLRITDTRKTTPGLRALERYAVRCGGGHNHREDLSSSVLIKDNHIAAAGGIEAAVARARAHAPHTSRIECEVDSVEQLERALAAKVDIVLLDNFDDARMAEAISIVQGRALIEVSGRLTLERIADIARLGAHIASVGALTHSAPAADLGLDWR